MEAVEKVDSKKQALEEAYERLIGHLHEMKREDFDPPTNPEDMAESAELSSTQKYGEADDTIAIHEDKSAPTFSIFRAQSDLNPKP